MGSDSETESVEPAVCSFEALSAEGVVCLTASSVEFKIGFEFSSDALGVQDANGNTRHRIKKKRRDFITEWVLSKGKQGGCILPKTNAVESAISINILYVYIKNVNMGHGIKI